MSDTFGFVYGVEGAVDGDTLGDRQMWVLLHDLRSCPDSELVRNPQNEINHLFLVQADAQVTSEDDVKAYAKYLQDMKEYIRPYMGKKEVFGIDCGDIVGDTPSLYPSYIPVFIR